MYPGDGLKRPGGRRVYHNRLSDASRAVPDFACLVKEGQASRRFGR
jgi:hypothetical protein